MISADLLRQIVIERGVTNPSEILLFLDIGVRNMLHQESDVLDGLDISICCFDHEADEVYFGGANQSILLGYAHDTAREVRGTRRTIGERRKPGQATQPFATHSFDLAKLNSIYLFTDGVLDQFGGELGRKLGKQRFIGLVNSTANLPMAEQRPALERGLQAWQGSRKQVDDHLVIGLGTH
jgi:two-component system, sensor histidine kinase LadS